MLLATIPDYKDSKKKSSKKEEDADAESVDDLTDIAEFLNLPKK
jgi:hypothetical protein